MSIRHQNIINMAAIGVSIINERYCTMIEDAVIANIVSPHVRWSRINSHHSRRRLARVRKSWAAFKDWLTERQFRHYFRMSKKLFQQFIDDVSTAVGADEFKSEEYLQNINETFKEWDRILTKNAHIVFTDLHPALIAMGAERAFTINSKVVTVRNYLHTLNEIRLIAKQLNWKELASNEIKIDEDLKAWYEKENAIEGYHKYYGVPIIYGMVFIKA